MGEFRMPALGADMDAGAVTEWLVHPGDHVARGDIVAIVATDKADIDVEVFENGVIAELLVPVGERVPVGTPLARITSEGAIEPAVPVPAPPPPPVPVTVVMEPSPLPPLPSPAPTRTVVPIVGPLIRHLAMERHVDLGAVHGTGTGGRITRDDVVSVTAGRSDRRKVTPRARRLARTLQVDLDRLEQPAGAVLTGRDVERAARAPRPQLVPAARPAAPAAAPVDGVASRRRAIAKLMSRSVREIPHYYVATRIPLDAAMSWLADHNASASLDDRLLPAALLLRAVTVAAVAVPELNGEWRDDAFHPTAGVHLGVAVAMRDGGLLTPTIRDADNKDLATVMRDLRDLVARARRGRLRAQELGGASITVTNLGDQGVESVFGVIVPPQVALAGFGAVHDEPWAESGLLGVRPVVTASLSADHRATDGRVGARFLDVVKNALQHPEEL
jgi:pyruvate dehydrogenase E2 component (dihydrolipoamide acetyltransferase)